MHTLLTCDACGHGAAMHSGGGCDMLSCGCGRHRQQVIDDALDAEAKAGSEQWRPHPD